MKKATRYAGIGYTERQVLYVKFGSRLIGGQYILRESCL
jgi:hypothetical protein